MNHRVTLRFRSAASLLFSLTVVASLSAMPVPAGERVLCVGEDGHVAVVSASLDECCEHGSEQPVTYPIENKLLQNGDCIDCIDLPLPGSEGRQAPRASKTQTPMIQPNIPAGFLPVSAELLTKVPNAAPVPASLVALRTVTLLI